MDQFLKGVNAYAISYDDPTLPAKVLDKNKTFSEKLKLKAALFEGKVVGSDQVGALAKLPSRDELLGQFISMLNSPMTKFASTLKGAITNLVTVLKSLEEKKK
jgi:large subunit ribosomal protein L10